MRVSKMKLFKIGFKQKTVLLLLLMVALMMGGAVLVPVLRETDETVSGMYYVFAAVLSVGAAVYALYFEQRISEGILLWLLPLAYVISLALLLLVDEPLRLPFWCFGGILLLGTFKIRYAVLMNYFLLFLIGGSQGTLLKEALIMQLLCLVLLSFVIPLVKKWMDAVNVIFSVISLLVSVRIIFFFVARQEIRNDDLFVIALVYIVIILSATFFSRLLQENVLQNDGAEAFDFLEELAVSSEMQDAALLAEGELSGGLEEKFAKILEVEHRPVTEKLFLADERKANCISSEAAVAVQTDIELTECLEKLCNEESEHLAKLSAQYPAAFLHARRVALIASELAEYLDEINVALVKAGGYYHEIGRLLGKNTLENTLLVAEAEDFPAPLVSVLREHTLNGDKPTSREAALVFWTDNICSMCEYLKKSQGGKVLVEKVVDKALNLRIAKGDFNASGLSVKDFSVIRNAMVDIIKEDMF